MKVVVAGVVAAVMAAGQSSQKLAESGHCREALPTLRADAAKATDPETQKRLGIDGVRCAVALDDMEASIEFLRGLNKRFPNDPDVLYLSVHAYSDLSIRASQKLLATGPSSYQVHELNAEALETQGRWSDAEAEYRAVLKKDPQLHGIHYRIGRLLLSGPETPSSKAEAKREFEAELKIDPTNAGAEYVLGELARQEGQDAAAIQHFGRAAKLDAGFVDAFIGLGRTLLAADRAAEAIPPLENAVKLDPGSPMAHFQLATAYTRRGRKEEAAREFNLQKQAAEKLQQTKQAVREGVAGAPPQ